MRNAINPIFAIILGVSFNYYLDKWECPFSSSEKMWTESWEQVYTFVFIFFRLFIKERHAWNDSLANQGTLGSYKPWSIERHLNIMTDNWLYGLQYLSPRQNTTGIESNHFIHQWSIAILREKLSQFFCVSFPVSRLAGDIRRHLEKAGKEGHLWTQQVYALKYVGARFLLSVPKHILVCLPGDQNWFQNNQESISLLSSKIKY